jgi:hypothetical protein
MGLNHRIPLPIAGGKFFKWVDLEQRFEMVVSATNLVDKLRFMPHYLRAYMFSFSRIYDFSYDTGGVSGSLLFYLSSFYP